MDGGACVLSRPCCASSKFCVSAQGLIVNSDSEHGMIRVRYVGWSPKFDEVCPMNYRLSRMRALTRVGTCCSGSTLTATASLRNTRSCSGLSPSLLCGVLVLSSRLVTLLIRLVSDVGVRVPITTLAWTWRCLHLIARPFILHTQEAHSACSVYCAAQVPRRPPARHEVRHRAAGVSESGCFLASCSC
jgi:hypothetical protein